MSGKKENKGEDLAFKTDLQKELADEQERWEEVTLLQELYEADYAATMLINLTQNTVEGFTGRNAPEEIKVGMEAERLLALLIKSIAKQDRREQYEKTFNRWQFIKDYQEGRRNYCVELQFLSHTLGRRWGSVAVSLTRNPLTGDVLAFLRAKDITREKMTEITLGDVIRNGYDFVVWIDMSTDRYEVVSANPDSFLMPKSSGRFSRDHLSFIEQYVPEKERAEVYSKFDFFTIMDELEQNPLYRFTYNLVDERGKHYIKRTMVSYIDPAAKVVLVTREDISEAVQDEKEKNFLLAQALEEEAHSKKMQEDFFSRLSHDLRTPLNSLLGISRIAEDELDSVETTKKYLRDISSCGEFMLELVNNILDISKIENGSMELKLAPFCHSELIADIKTVFGPLAAKKKIELIIDNGDGDIPVLADKFRLKQVAFNLISNAIKFSPVGGRVMYKVEKRTSSKGKVFTTTSVCDNGPGMSQDFQSRLFEPFSQENCNTCSCEQGSGLGLTIAKNLVELMGGSLSCASKLNEGTTFVATIPFIHYDGTPEIEQRARTLQKNYTVLEGRRVLVCEDHPLNSLVISKMLEKKGVMINYAENGKAAVEMFAQAADDYYDAILMDIRMPIMNGLEAAKAIRGLERERAKTIPIIAMTANAFESDRRSSLEVGMNAHLCKPIQQEELYDVLVKQIFK